MNGAPNVVALLQSEAQRLAEAGEHQRSDRMIAASNAVAKLLEAAADILTHCPAGKDWRMANGRGYTLPTGHVDDLRDGCAAVYGETP